jgi:hypothetical protein
VCVQDSVPKYDGRRHTFSRGSVLRWSDHYHYGRGVPGVEVHAQMSYKTSEVFRCSEGKRGMKAEDMSLNAKRS